MNAIRYPNPVSTRRFPLPAVVLALAGLVLVLPAAVARGEVKVEKKPAVVEYKTFDPANPPSDMPKLNEGETAATTYAFGCEGAVSVEMTQRILPNDKSFITYRVRKVTATLSLHIVVWLPEGANDKLKAHEEGHRQIAEKTYETADAVVRKVALKIDGRRVGGDGSSLEAAEKKANEAIASLNNQLTVGYREQVTGPTDRVQVIYDELTAHGTKPTPDEPTAIKLAFEKQAAEAKLGPKGPATKPATRPATAPVRPATKPAARPPGGR